MPADSSAREVFLPSSTADVPEEAGVSAGARRRQEVQTASGIGVGAQEENATRRPQNFFRKTKRIPMDVLNTAWLDYDPRAGGRPTFFNNLRISRDGGFSTIPALYNPLRYLWASVALGMIVVNVRALLAQDWPSLTTRNWACSMSPDSDAPLCTQAEKTQFLLTDIVLNKAIFWTDLRLDPEVTVALLDLLLLVMVALRGVYLLVRGVCFSRSIARRWDSISDFFQIVIPELGTVSAMSFLYYVSPSVISPHLAHRIFRLLDVDAHKTPAVLDLIGFTISRFLALLVGFDAFLVKFSSTATIYLDNTPGGEAQGSVAAMIMLGAFLNQILGVVNVTWFVKRRLFIFIFGGEDGYMNEEEELRKRLWNAMLVREMWLRFSDRHKILHICKFCVMMLSFCDYDFQRMSLKEYGGMPADIGTGIGPSFCAASNDGGSFSLAIEKGIEP